MVVTLNNVEWLLLCIVQSKTVLGSWWQLYHTFSLNIDIKHKYGLSVWWIAFKLVFRFRWISDDSPEDDEQGRENMELLCDLPLSIVRVPYFSDYSVRWMIYKVIFIVALLLSWYCTRYICFQLYLIGYSYFYWIIKKQAELYCTRIFFGSSFVKYVL